MALTVPWDFDQQGRDAALKYRQPRPSFLVEGVGQIAAQFVPPAWRMATPLAQFPAVQSDPASAIPSYDAGPQVGAVFSMPNISAPFLLKPGPGTLFQINVVVAGTSPGGAYDAAQNQVANVAVQVAVIPNTIGPLVLEWSCQQGILIIPGAGQVVAAKWC